MKLIRSLLFFILLIPVQSVIAGTDDRIIKVYNLISLNKTFEAGIEINKLVESGVFNDSVNKKLLIDLGNNFKFNNNYIQACKAFDFAYNISKDRETKLLLNNCQTKEGEYIIQVGAFLSGVNANNIIKEITPPAGQFTLVKKNHRGLYYVYFDNVDGRISADRIAEKLKSLNNNIRFMVIRKDKFLQ